jgi:hypothetical protein
VLATGVVEVATGAAGLAGGRPVVVGATMAALGLAFTAILIRVHRSGVSGDCGCVLPGVEDRVTGRALTRAGFVLGAGVVEATVDVRLPPAGTRPWALAVLVGVVVMVSLAMADQPMRTPVCHRRLWRPLRDTIGGLIRHPVYAAVDAQAGPLGDAVGHRRFGCTEEFWFAPAGRRDGRAVVFRVSRPRPAGDLSVQASIVAAVPADVRWPARLP